MMKKFFIYAQEVKIEDVAHMRSRTRRRLRVTVQSDVMLRYGPALTSGAGHPCRPDELVHVRVRAAGDATPTCRCAVHH
eukprot:762419-Hanusia_phi.AAC.7